MTQRSENQRSENQRTVAQKMGVRPHSRAHLHDPPEGVLADLALPELEVRPALEGDFDYLHLFATKAGPLREDLARLHAHLRPGGMLWVSWPKGGRLGTDLNMKHVIAIGYDQGLVESICLRINEVWSGLKFTHPKPDKIYRNSHGTLPWQR